MTLIITQLIYVVKGQETVFHRFEELVIPIISKYKGRLLLRLRSDGASVIDNNIEPPYELHLVEFDTEADFEAFTKDEERKQFLHLKEQSIRSSLLIKGSRD